MYFSILAGGCWLAGRARKGTACFPQAFDFEPMKISSVSLVRLALPLQVWKVKTTSIASMPHHIYNRKNVNISIVHQLLHLNLLEMMLRRSLSSRNLHLFRLRISLNIHVYPEMPWKPYEYNWIHALFISFSHFFSSFPCFPIFCFGFLDENSSIPRVSRARWRPRARASRGWRTARHVPRTWSALQRKKDDVVMRFCQQKWYFLIQLKMWNLMVI